MELHLWLLHEYETAFFVVSRTPAPKKYGLTLSRLKADTALYNELNFSGKAMFGCAGSYILDRVPEEYRYMFAEREGSYRLYSFEKDPVEGTEILTIERFFSWWFVNLRQLPYDSSDYGPPFTMKLVGPPNSGKTDYIVDFLKSQNKKAVLEIVDREKANAVYQANKHLRQLFFEEFDKMNRCVEMIELFSKLGFLHGYTFEPIVFVLHISPDTLDAVETLYREGKKWNISLVLVECATTLYSSPVDYLVYTYKKDADENGRWKSVKSFVDNFVRGYNNIKNIKHMCVEITQ